MHSVFFQFTLYMAVRLAHRGFTLGELGLVSFGATVLFSEMLNITRARVSFAFLLATPWLIDHYTLLI